MEKNEQFSVLWLPAWYPSELDQFNGDFIQRHARAAALYCKVQVICLVHDAEGKITKDIKVTESVSGNLAETIIYYHSGTIIRGISGKLFSGLKYIRLYKKAIRHYLLQNGKPCCAHVHVADKNGLMALWLKRSRKIPFVLSEHWTIYLQEAEYNWDRQPWWFKKIWKRILAKNSGISVVSSHLAKSMIAIGAPAGYRVIPNVVDRNIFFPGETEKAALPAFIHISMLNYQKNFEDILKAFAVVKNSGYEFKLDVFGPVTDNLREQTHATGLGKEVQFHGEVPQPILADHLRNAIALIHYSRYETFGCVIIEAHACGIPVIASDLPVHHETITEGVNGVFAEGEHPAALAEKIIEFLKERKQFAKKEMHDTTIKRYGYEVAGKSFYEWYQSLTSNMR